MANPDSLRLLAAEKGKLIGAAVSGPALDDPIYRQIAQREFNIIVPENGTHFFRIHPTADRYDFSEADRVLDFAQGADMKVRGHTLVWHQALPQWITNGHQPPVPSVLRNILADHIATVVGRYAQRNPGRIVAWDVVNEAVDDDGRIRNSIWSPIGSTPEEYIALAFQWAHQADPKAKLFYNDYGAEDMGTKSEAVYRLVKKLKARGVPIDGVGLQMHMSVRGWTPKSQLMQNISRLGALGLEVHITEMEVVVPLAAVPTSNEKQALVYAEVMDACLRVQNCKALLTWGFTDKYGWNPEFRTGVGFGLPYDMNLQPKLAYFKIREILQQP